MNECDLTAIDGLFEKDIFPGFPFKNKRWLGIAFDRDRWVTRLPQWYFEEMQDLLLPRDVMCIYGSSASGSDQTSSYTQLGSFDFSWKEFLSFITSDANYSPEYWMFDRHGRWACRADPELTVWGADPLIMRTVYSRHGGSAGVLRMMTDEMDVLREVHDDMYRYLQELVGLCGDAG
jgi:hypothetical protein